jgi:DHA1 family multidrug resistance protein-like MFS transporter
MLLRALAGGGLVIFLIGFAQTPAQFLVLRVLQGAVTGTVAAATVFVATVVPEEEVGLRLGLLQTAIAVGNSLGPLAGGYMAEAIGHRFTFFVTSLMLILAALVIQFWAKETFVPTPPKRFTLRSMLPDIRPVLDSRAVLTLVILAGLIQTGIAFVIPILPLYVQEISNGVRVASTTGLILGVSALASAAASALTSLVARRIGSAQLLALSFLLAALFHIPQAFAWSTDSLLVSRVLTAIMLGMAIPLINILLAQNTEKSRQGSIYGLAASTNAIGLAAGPMIAAAVAVALGYKAVFISAGLILAGAAWLAWKTLRR